MAQNNFIASGIQNWTTAVDWSLGHVPTSSEDAFIGTTGAIVGSSVDETVKSIGTGSSDALDLNGGIFTADQGTGPNINSGTIYVYNANLTVNSGTIDNAGTIELAADSTSVTTFFFIQGFVQLQGGGSFEMSTAGVPLDNEVGGETPSAILWNDDNDISGTGTIGGVSFTNFGIIETNNSTGAGFLNLYGSAGGGSFDNEGSVFADDGGTLELGTDSFTANMGNAGLIELVAGGDKTEVQIAGTFTINSVGGQILLGGPDPSNDYIVSDGHAATLNLDGGTLSGAGNIGDAKLTLNIEAGTVIDATGVGGELTLNTSTNLITNAGEMKATSDGTHDGILNLGSSVTNSGTIIAQGLGSQGATVVFAHSDNTNNMGSVIRTAINGVISIEGYMYNYGTVRAVDGLITLSAEVFNFSGGTVEIGSDGTLDLAAGGLISGNAQFSGTGATLQLDQSTTQVGEIVGFAGGDGILLTFQGFASGDHMVWTQSTAGTGTLALVNSGGTTLQTLNLQGEYTSSDFSVTSSGGNALIQEVANWFQIDGGTPVAMAGGDFQGLGSAQLIASEPGAATYLWSAGSWTKIDGGVYSLMAAANFYGTSNGNNNNIDLAAYDPGVGTYIWNTSVGWAKIDGGAVAALAAGNFKGSVNGLVASETGAGTYLWSFTGGWTKIDGGVYTLMAAGDFYGTTNGNGNHSDVAAYDPGVGTFIWSASAGWSKIDSGAASAYAAGNFLGTSDGNNNQTDLAAYFAGSGTYIWSANAGWSKIDSGTASGLTAVDLNGNGQNELLAYFPGAGMYEWQNGVGWNKYDSTSALPTGATQALFATGNFQGGPVVDAAAAFNGANHGIWLDPPAAATSSGSSVQNIASSVAGTAQVAGQLNPAAFATPVAAPSGTPQNGQSPAFAATIAGVAGQDQPTLGYSANSGGSGGAPTAANDANTANIALLGSYMASSFVTSGDGNGSIPTNEVAQIVQTTPLAQPHAAA
jgi:hypothetical protein